MAATSQLTPESESMLLGKQIIRVGLNYIVLDSGLNIYLSDSEIDDINSWKLHNQFIEQ
jgi:hypothetical protein